MHLMYVDESGDPGFPKPGEEFPVAGGPSRSFLRAGVVVHSWKWSRIDAQIADFKKAWGLGRVDIQVIQQRSAASWTKPRKFRAVFS